MNNLKNTTKAKSIRIRDKRPENQILVIFGASGDLTQRKLIPSLYALYAKNLMPKKFIILGVSRTQYSTPKYRNLLHYSVIKSHKNVPVTTLRSFLRHIKYVAIDTSDPEEYYRVKNELEHLSVDLQIDTKYLFYLAIPPILHKPVIAGLKYYGLTGKNSKKNSIIIEKPFGHDYNSAKSLNLTLKRNFSEKQIFRMDHYLGKETVQNIIVTRFANIFDSIWNKDFIEYIEITSAESEGIGNRGGYYDEAGALRDMLQNHLLHLLALTTMDPPSRLNEISIQKEMKKVLSYLKPMSPNEVKENVIRGQYLSSHFKGKKLNGYRQEPGIAKKSATETFVALRTQIDNTRWKGVPIYIRTGKRMPTKVTEIVIHFKQSRLEHYIRPLYPSPAGNLLIIRIQPDEGILLKILTKKPGVGFDVRETPVGFHFHEIEKADTYEAYQRLLYDAIRGDRTLYMDGSTLLVAWKFIDTILAAWRKDKSIKLYGYPAGTWGPEQSDKLMQKGKQTWRYPCKNLVGNKGYCEL